jgi:LuxR family transcriptional regulator, quorum-sensing system regulator CciR
VSQLSDVQKFIDASRHVSSARDLHNLLTNVSIDMGFDHFALIHHVDLTPMNAALTHMDTGELVALTNYPEVWIEAYVARRIVANDPILLASERTNVGFIWEEADRYIDITSEHKLITEDTRKAGLANGYTVPANVPGEANGSCNFALRTGRALRQENLPMAQLVGSFAFQAARSLVSKAQKTLAPPLKALTDRQLECLILVAKGKSDWEIGKILGISQNTVKRHLEGARLSYDVTKSIQVLMRAIHQGRIALSDVLQ